MNKIIKKNLLARDKFMPELQLRKPGFTYTACGAFTKCPERIEKILELLSDLKHIYKNKLVKTCFAHDAAYSDSKDLPKRTTSDKILKDRAHEIAINPKYGVYQRELASMV